MIGPGSEKLLKIIKEIQEVQRKVCTEWEITFIETMRCRVNNIQYIYEGQAAKLEEIYQKVCDSPY